MKLNSNVDLEQVAIATVDTVLYDIVIDNDIVKVYLIGFSSRSPEYFYYLLEGI